MTEELVTKDKGFNQMQQICGHKLPFCHVSMAVAANQSQEHSLSVSFRILPITELQANYQLKLATRKNLSAISRIH